MNRVRSAVATGALLIGTASGVLLYRFSPMQYRFYPRCPIYTYLHVLCPGCGATRALAALLHGRLHEAVHWNALFVALLPFFAGYVVVCCLRAFRTGTFLWPQPPRIAITVLLLIATAFTLTRNL
jgi:hypothetical protein